MEDQLSQMIIKNRGGILLYNPIISNNNIVSRLIKQPLLKDYHINIVTNIITSYGTWISNYELYNYKEIRDKTETAIESIVIFDDIEQVIENKLIDYINEYRDKFIFIILATEGNSEPESIYSLYKESIYAYMPVIDIATINFDPIVINLTSDQSKELMQFRQNKELIFEKQVSNFFYPVKSAQKYIDQYLLPDTDVNNNGWMNNEILNNINIYSPKIHNLLLLIQQYPNEGHLIYTHFYHRSGIKLISTLLNYLQLEHIILTNNDINHLHLHKILNFNSSPIKILLTNIVPNILVSKIGHVHFLDFFDINIYYRIDKCLAKTTVSSIIFHYYLCDVNSTDIDFYNKFIDNLTLSKNNFNTLITKGTPVSYSQSYGFVI